MQCRALGAILALLLAACAAAPAASPAASPICRNQTQEVLASIRTHITIPATADVIDARQTCADGYHWTGTECVQQIVTDGHCAAGFQWLDGRCERTENALCPAGYHMSATTGRCSLRVEFQVNCPPEHAWNGVQCVHNMPSCRAGYELVDGVCRKLVEGRCPTGTVMEDGVCVQVKTSQFECLDGYELIGDQCRRRGEIICEAGARLVDGRCVREVSVGPEYQCPDDKRLEGTKCVSRVNHCPSGYVLNGTECVNETITCPPNSTLNVERQECVKQKCLPVEPGCAEGFRFWNGACIEVSPPDQPHRCNSTEVLVNGTCVSTCRTLKPECPDDEVVCNRCPSQDFYLVGTLCVYKLPHCFVHPCPYGYVWQNLRCELEERTCLSGYVLHDGRCVQQRPQIDWKCPIGWYPVTNGDHECVRVNITCPLGQTLNNASVCVTVCTPGSISCTPQPQPPPPHCEPGYTMHNGVCYCDSNPPKPQPQPQPTPRPQPTICPADRPTRLPNGTCSTTPTCVGGNCAPICPSGFHYDATIGRCVQSCPEGFEQRPDGSCQQRPCAPGTWRNAHGVCVRFVCPDGFDLRADGNCIQRPCAHGWWRNAAGACVRVVCPPGYDYSQGACFPRAPAIVQPNCTSACHPGGEKPASQQQNPNVVHTVTIVDRPVNVVTNNENNVNVHLYENGRLVRIQRNNETVIVPNNGTHVDDGGEEVDNNGGESVVDVDENNGGEDGNNGGYDDDDNNNGGGQQAKCCVVVSPRKCEQKDGQWECTHRETQQCGWFCTSARVYLIPRRTVFRNSVLVMRPPPNGANWWRHAGWNAGALDCSGCVGGSYACSQQCYQYEACEYRDDCNFMDQKAFCDTNPAVGCAEEDGCFDIEY